MQPTTLTLHTQYQIGEVDPRIFGGLLDHMGRAVYLGVYVPKSAHADAGVRSKWYLDDWIPFASSGSGDFLCIDTNPTKKGTVGQIISLDHESAARCLIAPSTSEFLARLNAYWCEVN